MDLKIGPLDAGQITAGQMDIGAAYETNASFRAYVDAYCKSRGLTKKEALEHTTVKETAKYYQDKTKDIIEPSGQQAQK